VLTKSKPEKIRGREQMVFEKLSELKITISVGV
jgi:hypothetical protein